MGTSLLSDLFLFNPAWTPSIMEGQTSTLRFVFVQTRVYTIYAWGSNICFKIIIVKLRFDTIYKWGRAHIYFQTCVCSISFWHHLCMRGMLTLRFILVQSHFDNIYKWGATNYFTICFVQSRVDTIYKWSVIVCFEICSIPLWHHL